MRKKWIVVLLMLFGMLAFTACGQQDEPVVADPIEDTVLPDSPPDNGGRQDPGPIEDEGWPIIYAGQMIYIPGNFSPPLEKAITLTRGEKVESKRVALTFDAGWIFEPTAAILEILRDNGVKATFFLRGGWVEANPNLVRQIAEDGHIIGNHSLTHGHMKDMTEEAIRHEIIATTELIRDVAGVESFMFRPPYGEYNEQVLRVLAQEGHPYNIMWTIDTHDWMEPGVTYIIDRATKELIDGAIILMHVGSTQVVAALPTIIERYAEAGFEFVSVDHMVPKEFHDAQRTETYKVEPGDTLFSIAQKYGTTIDDIVEHNDWPQRK